MPIPAFMLRARAALAGLGVVGDRGSWLEPGGLLACAYPRGDAALAALAAQGVSVLVNLHTRGHHPERLARYGLRELHLPVPDFAAPTPEQLRAGVAAIGEARAAGQAVAVHCGAGLGRTGTLLACYLVAQGSSADEAVARVRAARPGSIETRAQRRAIDAYQAWRNESGR